MKAIITVVGKDMIGIMAKVSNVAAEAQANILEVTQSVLDGYFAMIMLVDLSAMSWDVDELEKALFGRMTTVAGPSGAGKSSIINCLLKSDRVETGSISEKLGRGKHTTRHSEIIPLGDDTYIIDTPGFGSFDLFDVMPQDLGGFYEEFAGCKGCRFSPCSHTHEPGCAVKEAVEKGAISKLRYENYTYIYNELTAARRY